MAIIARNSKLGGGYFSFRGQPMGVTVALFGLSVAVGALVGAVFGPTDNVVRGALVALAVSPLAEYCLHRFISHSTLLYRTPLTASVWKRIHYDHHLDPADDSNIFAAARHVIPNSIVCALPIGWLAGGLEGALAATSMALLWAGIVEIVHANSHVPLLPDWAYFRMLKRLHRLHHYRNETVNFGVTSPLFDVVFRTYSGGKIGQQTLPRSASVRTLGYGSDEAKRYPWLMQMQQPSDEARADTDNHATMAKPGVRK